MPTVMSRTALFAAVLSVLLALGASGRAAPAQEKKEPPTGAQVFVYPEKLTAKDRLVFGDGGGEPIEIKGETTLIWVDLQPGARFAHPTECVLVSAGGTRVVKGDWWLVLNGRPLFRDGKGYKADFPVKLGGT